MVRTTLGILMLLILSTVAACGGINALPTTTSPPHLLTFNVSHISVDPSGKTHIELAVANSGPQELPANTYVAHFQLSHADGSLRAGQDAVLPRIPPSTGDLTTVVGLNAPLEAGEYHVSWGAPGLGATLVTFEIVSQDGGLRLGRQTAERFGPGAALSNSRRAP